jgi:GNAT superfamily N-acetyltransferase
MDLAISSISDRPDLAPLLDDFPGAWPTFMLYDPISSFFYQLEKTDFAEFALIAVDRDAPERPVAKAVSIPFSWPGDPDHELPPGGYDEAIRLGIADRLAGRRGNLVSPVEIAVRVELRGTGLSALMLDALRRNTARLGYRSLVAPVRPTLKHRYPYEPLAGYAARVRPDGLPEDPWLRVHVRAGGRIGAVAPRSMTITGTVAEWRDWTGLPFDASGPVIVPEALVPVHCDLTADHAVYVEPNVWVHHRL